jgi:predicted ATPase
MDSIKKYSDWLKIDLHIHSNYSTKTKDNDYKGNFSVDVLKSKLVENDVAIFSLTDHNIINLDAYKEYYEKYDTNTDPLLLLGIELDVEVDGYDGNKRRYHTLLIFNYSNHDNAKKISNKLEAKYNEKKLSEKNRVLSIDDIITLFPNDDFFFIPHAGNVNSIVTAYKNQIDVAQKMILLMPSASEKVAEKLRYKYNEGFNKKLTEAFQNKADHAYVEFTDNHNIEKYPCTHMGNDNKMHEFYYIKGSKNFETLRLAFIDPKSRIKSKQEFHVMRNVNNIIEKIKIIDNPKLEDNEISFSPHLNVLIGGRSSGKSLMMSILGNKIDTNIDSTKYNLNYDRIKIKTKLNNDFEEKTVISKDDVIYLKQGDIIKYFENNQLLDLAKDSEQLEMYHEAKKSFKEHLDLLKKCINDLLFVYNKCEIDKFPRFVLHNTAIEYISNSSFIFIYEQNKIADKYNNLSYKIQESEKLLIDISNNLASFNNNDLLELKNNEKYLTEELIKIISEKQLLINKKEKNNINKINFVNIVNNLIEEKNAQLDLEARQKQEAKQSLKHLKENIKEVFNNYFNLRKYCVDLENFEYGLMKEIKITTDVKLILEVSSNDNKIKNLFIEGILNGTQDSSIYLNILHLLQGEKSIKNYNNLAMKTLEKKIDSQLKIIYEKFDTPMDYLIYANGDTSKNNSPGYNSEKYLDIILKNPKSKIIFIDQPEDNLGNKFISEQLVKLIRDIKFNKQIFLVTHNPSIVVYGDAENIIIANNDNNLIKYKQVVLEDSNAQKEICRILDGGEYIFNMRSRKYNIKRILNEEEKEYAKL